LKVLLDRITVVEFEMNNGAAMIQPLLNQAERSRKSTAIIVKPAT